MSNIQSLFSETLSSNKRDQIISYKILYQDVLLTSFTESPPVISTTAHTGKQISDQW